MLQDYVVLLLQFFSLQGTIFTSSGKTLVALYLVVKPFILTFAHSSGYLCSIQISISSCLAFVKQPLKSFASLFT